MYSWTVPTEWKTVHTNPQLLVRASLHIFFEDSTTDVESLRLLQHSLDESLSSAFSVILS